MPVETSASVAATGALAHFTRAELMVPHLRGAEPASIIHELARALQAEGFVPDLLPFYHAALNQELMANSGLDYGIAIPHARLGGITRLQFALGRTPDPIPWCSRSASPAQLIFLLAVPATDAARYLHLLASLARLGQQRDLLAELRKAPDPTSMYRVLEKVKIRLI